MPHEKDSSVFAIDHNGKVWVINGHNRNASWSPLPNPTRVDFKRVASANETIWGISCDHQIYNYVMKRDIPIRVREETYENQRWNPVGGFCDNLLPTDRFHYSNEAGTENRAKELIKLPASADAWIWKGDWQIENTCGSEIAHDGWTYAVDFPATYTVDKHWNSCVRRRKWYRVREYVATNRWNLIAAVHEDFTSDPFTDVSVGSHGGLSCVWSITVNGRVYFRKNVNPESCPEGTSWEQINVTQGIQDAAQVSVSTNGIPFIVTWTGGLLYRIGITPKNLAGSDWLITNGPPGGIFQISAGKESLWAITRDKKCWSMKGELQAVLAKKSLDPFEWIEIPGRMKAIAVSKTDLVVLGIGSDDNLVFTRFGVTKEQRHGQGWKPAFGSVSWDSVSTSSSETSTDHVDGLHSGDESDAVSIQPEIPQGCPVIDNGPSNAHGVSLCWVDGGCASSLNFGVETDLEIGPWRDEILSGLQFQRCERNKFSYPNAIESSSTSWSKSVKVRMMQHHQRVVAWTKGELEMSNNDTIVFYKDLTHCWMCAVSDILSIILARDSSSSFTLRIRNAIEPGVADFVTFKFEHENNMEEWRLMLIDVSVKPHEEWSLANAWLTTNNGEVHEAGMAYYVDTPMMSGTEVVTVEEGKSDVKVHNPLVKGFLPGSEIKIDIVVPSDILTRQGGGRFALNLNGRDSVAYHFNPRFEDKVVVRNSRDTKGDWGEEERDGVFPFQPGQAYSITISCMDSQFVTTVQAKHKFMFYYKHRFLPKYITHLVVVGDVSVVSVRYDPQRNEEAKNLEFITNPVPGHFWKVESAGSSFTWAIGTDLNVWAYAGGSGSNRKMEHENIVTDETIYTIYENQRWNPLSGFTSHGLPTDRAPWSDETGRVPLDKESIKLPSSKWSWVADWEIDYDVSGGVDKTGWQYAVDFPASYHSSKRFNDFVRRRRWMRSGRHTDAGPWIHIPNIKLIDICVQMNDECDMEVLGISEKGDAVVRSGITKENPCGTNWLPLTSQKSFISISSFYQQRIWAIGKDGFAYIYYNHWQLLDRPHGAPLKQIRVGPAGVFAVGINNVLYRRTEIDPKVFPEGKEWTKVCDNVLQVSLPSDDSVWALIKKGDTFHCSIAKRRGIGKANPNGVGFDVMAEGPWQYFAMTGSYGRNH